MRKGFIKRIVLFFAIAAASFNMHTAFAASSLAGKMAMPGTYSHLQGEMPNAELEITHMPVHAGIHSVVHKFTGSSFLCYTAVLKAPAAMISNGQLWQSSLLTKDYLLYIYPSHHFW